MLVMCVYTYVLIFALLQVDTKLLAFNTCHPPFTHKKHSQDTQSNIVKRNQAYKGGDLKFKFHL